VCGIASTRSGRLAMPMLCTIKTACILAWLLLSAGMSGCGQVMERIQGKSSEKPSPTAASSPAQVQSTSHTLPTKESAEPSAPVAAGQASAAPTSPDLRPGAPSTPILSPSTSPSTSAAPGPTAPQAISSPPAELHQAPQEAPSATRIYRSSDARRP
jgi:uncharacterized protein YceK